MSKSVLVPIADGTEEIEAVCIIDVLRRAGADVTVASVDQRQVTASRGVTLVADKQLSECSDAVFDLIALPGGVPGAEHLRDSEILTRMLEQQKNEGRLFAAICASPAVVLQTHGLLEARLATCHPSFEAFMGRAAFSEDRVVVDANCITSRGPGTAIEFSLALVEQLYGKQKAEETAAPMVMPGPGDFMGLIQKRRSIRRFSQRPVDKETVDMLIEAALRSPSSRSIRPWEFIVVTDGDLLERLAVAKPHGSSFLKNAPLGIVVCADTSQSDVWVEDTAIAVTYIQLAAEAAGLGSCWIQIRKREHSSGTTSSRYVSEILGLPEQLAVEAVVAVGYPAEVKAPHKKESLLVDKVSYNRDEAKTAP